jgi:hypothetical protein
MKKEALAFVFTPEFRAEEAPFTMVPGREFGARIMPLLGPVWLFYIWITFFSF